MEDSYALFTTHVSGLFVISAYALTNVASEAERDSFYRELTRLVHCAKSTDIVVLSVDMNAQVGRPTSVETHLGGRFGVSAQVQTIRTDCCIFVLIIDYSWSTRTSNTNSSLRHT